MQRNAFESGKSAEFPPARRPRGALVGLWLLGLLLVWRIATVSLPASFATQAPSFALTLAPGDPAALTASAQQKLETFAEARAHTAAARQAEEIVVFARRAVAASPLDAEAFRILGAVSPPARAREFMRASLLRSTHQADALFWLMRDSFAAGQYAETGRLANILLSVQPQALPAVIPFLAQMAEKPEAMGEIDRLMASRPRWRDAFLNELPLAAHDARTPLRVMSPLKDAPVPPKAESLARYLKFLLEHRLYAFAYDVWRSFLSGQQLEKTGLLFNGDFAWPPSGLPFDWEIARGESTAIEILPHPDGGGRGALSIVYGAGRTTPHGASQLVRLAPGSYRLKGRYRGELIGRRGLRWQVSCIGAADVLGESEMALGVAREWKDFAFEFTTPSENCPLQQVTLGLAARSPSEWLVSGSLLYADLAIEPLKQPVAARDGEPARAK